MKLSEVVRAAQEKTEKYLKVARPGIIKSYDYKKQMAEIELSPDVLNDGGTMRVPNLSGVPVLFPRCGGASITLPVRKGDGCLVFFLDRDSREWLDGKPKATPLTRRTHNYNDAVAIMGLTPFSATSVVTNNLDVTIQFQGTKVTLKPDGILDIEAAKKINVKTENIVIECKSADVTVKETAKVSCKNLAIKSSGDIQADCTNFNVKGKMQVQGEIVSNSTITGANVQTSSGVGLAGHTHTSTDTLPNGSQLQRPTTNATGGSAGGGSFDFGDIGL